MREVEFQYMFKHKRDKIDIRKETFTLLEIEQGEASLSYNHWEIVARREYTGSLDKFNIKIYEGDICKTRISAFTADDDTTGVVLFHDSKFMRKIHYSNTSFGYHDLFGRHCEVVGNIYENPELLNAK